MSSFLYGLHDRQAAPHVPDGGWCVDTIALSETPAPQVYDPRLNWIVRANWGYGSTGCIPLPFGYRGFANLVGNYMRQSQNANIVIVGNEINHEQERPNGTFVTPAEYVRCFVMVRDTVKQVKPSVQVLPSPMAPYHANPVNWLDYWREMLGLIADNGGCDGIAVHAYTRSSKPEDIDSAAKMGPPLQDQFSGFRVYEDALDAVPASLRQLPAYITEFNELLNDGWHDVNTGVVQAAYEHVDEYNKTRWDVDPVIHALILYRWPQFDKWHIEGKQGVIDDFKAAVARGYTSPVKGNSVTDTFIPVVSNPGNPVTEPSLPPRQIDQRLLDRDTKVMDAKVQPGMEYWRLVRARWFDEQESQGRHHIYVETLDEQGKPVADVLFVVAWPSGSTESRTKGGLGFDAGNVPMSPGRNAFTVSVPLSDLVTGIGMGQDYPDGFNAGVHTSTLLTYQLVTMPAAVVPTQPPIVSPGLQPVTQPQPPVQPAPSGDRWERSIQWVLKREGGFQNNPADKGNYYEGRLIGTKFGISAASWGGQYDIPNLTIEQARSIYFEHYWRKSGADRLEWPLCLLVLDTATLHGTGASDKWLAEVGPNPYAFAAKRLRVYTKSDNGDTFWRGWVNRVGELLEEIGK